MCVHDITLDHLSGTDTAVVRSLRGREASNRPAVGVVVEVEESVFLLETEPGHVVGMGLHQRGSVVASVELVGCAVGVEALAQDEDVVAAGRPEGVGEDCDGFEEDVGVVIGRLAWTGEGSG